MDSVPSYEFAGIFDRTSGDVNLKGCFTAEAIAEKLNDAKNKCEHMRAKAVVPKHRAKLKRKAIQYQNLIEYGFPERVIKEARSKPNGIFAMTLKFGKTDAKARILARKNTQIRIRGQREQRLYPR
jgi:hypothetical protein